MGQVVVTFDCSQCARLVKHHARRAEVIRYQPIDVYTTASPSSQYSISQLLYVYSLNRKALSETCSVARRSWWAQRLIERSAFLQLDPP